MKIVNGWVADTGTDPVGRVQIGDTAAKTWTANFAGVRLDTTPGQRPHIRLSSASNPPWVRFQHHRPPRRW